MFLRKYEHNNLHHYDAKRAKSQFRIKLYGFNYIILYNVQPLVVAQCKYTLMQLVYENSVKAFHRISVI